MLLFFIGASAACIDADRMTSQSLGGFDPLVVILDSLSSLLLVRVTQISFAVNHDQHLLDTIVGGTLVQLGKIGHVLSLVLEELVDILDGFNAELFLGRESKVEVVQFLGEDRFVE